MEAQGKSILVLPDETPDETKGGVVINKAVTNKPDSGTVIQRGPGCEITSPGDHIQYKRKGAHIIQLEGVEHHFIIEEQVLFNGGPISK